MNLILFTEEELESPLPMSDPRSQHIMEVLRRSAGESFDIGIVDGKRGRARIDAINELHLELSYDLTDDPPSLLPVGLVVGLSRPQTMRRILRDCASMGVCRLHFFASERGEAGYAESALWKSGEYRRHLIDGAQQAFTTLLPEVRLFPSLSEAVDGEGFRAALDNYEAESSLHMLLREAERHTGETPLCRPGVRRRAMEIIVGSERGWSDKERAHLRDLGVPLVHLGERVLRTDVACIAAVGIVLSDLGFYEG